MLRYIPDFILQQYGKQQFRGSFTGYALLFDIADFTPISTEFQKHGKQGAEELSKFLDFVFGEPIAIVQSNGGFVSLFAGDAFCAIFHDCKPESIISAVNSIRCFFQDKSSYQTALGSFTLKIRQTVVYGDIHWQTYENELQNEYVFHGDTMAELAMLSNAKEELIFSESAALMIGEKRFENQKQGYTLISQDIFDVAKPQEFTYSQESKTHFINPKYAIDVLDNEIRSGAFCFANLEAIPADGKAKAITTIQKLADKYGGFVNKYDATDKGLVGIILFGIPRSEGNTLQRICDFSLEAIGSEPLLALGICCGSVFAGFTGAGETREYTAIGHPLNLASRLMSKARSGEVLADTFLWQELHRDYHFNYLGMLNLKGVSLPIRYYTLNNRTDSRANFQENRFVGRDEEIIKIRETIQISLIQNQNTIIYVSGDPGIGKSRLVKEAISSFSTSTVHYFRISCDAIIKSPWGIIKQILRSHFFLNPSLPKEAGTAMFRALWPILAAGDAELIRVESILASLIGYEWEASVWSVLPPNEKPAQLRKAIIGFMEQLSRSKPILIHLDDGQWLDEDSKEILQELSAKEISPIVIVSPCRYLDDGSKVDLGLSKHQRIDIELGILSDQGCMELIQSILRLNKVPYDTLRLIIDRSMGNPLFVEQLSSYLQENGILDDKGKITGEVGYLSSFSISDIVGSRVDRLSENVRESMFSASVLGMEFNAIVLTQMLNSEPIEELQAGISNRIWKDLDELHYIFTHILIKDIVYQRLMSEKLQKLHQNAAEAMEMVYVDNLAEHAEEIAMHFEKAGLEEKAGIYFYKAGTNFCETYQLKASETCLLKSFQILKRVFRLNNEHVARVLESLADLYLKKGNHLLAIEYSRSAIEVYEAINGCNHISSAFARLSLALALRFDGNMQEAYNNMIEVLSIRENSLGKDHPSVAMTLAHLVSIYQFYQEYDKAEDAGRRAVAILETHGQDKLRTAFTVYRLAEALISTGKYAEAEVLFNKALNMYEDHQANHPESVKILISYSILCRINRDIDKAETLCEKALQICCMFWGENNSNTAFAMQELAAVYLDNKQYHKAIKTHKKVLKIIYLADMERHPLNALCQLRIGFAYHALSMQKHAEPYYLYAFRYYENAVVENNILRVRTAKLLVNLYEDLNDEEKAEEFRAFLPDERTELN